MEAFANLPGTSRAWIYQSDREFTPAEVKAIDQELNSFVIQWQAHKVTVAGAAALLQNRFVILAADEGKLEVSGCSIDSTVKFVRELAAKYNVNFFDRFYTSYMYEGRVEGCDFETFKARFERGEVTEDTIVFNNLTDTLAKLDDQWQIPLRLSWQMKFITQTKPALKL